MIYEVIYKNYISEDFEDHVNNVFKINYNHDCFVYFHLGKNASKFLNVNCPDMETAYSYCLELEKKFNVTINWFNLEHIFDKLINFEHLNFRTEDIERVLYYYKMLFYNSIEDYLDKNKL